MPSKSLSGRDRDVLKEAAGALLQRRLAALQTTFPFPDLAGKALLERLVNPPDVLAKLQQAYAVAPEMVATAMELRLEVDNRLPFVLAPADHPQAARKPLRLKIGHAVYSKPHFFYPSPLHYGQRAAFVDGADPAAVEALTAYANDWWKVWRENARARELIAKVANACSTSGQIMDLWPTLGQLASDDPHVRAKLSQGRDAKRVRLLDVVARLEPGDIDLIPKVEEVLAMAYMMPKEHEQTLLVATVET